MKTILLSFIICISIFAQGTWTQQNSGLTDAALRSVKFIDQNTGWAVGQDQMNALVLNTIDGGLNWNIKRLYNGQYNFASVFFIDSLSGWIAGDYFNNGNPYGIVLKTTNGGNDWDLNSLTSYGWFQTIFFINSNVGWVGGASGILKTTNGGVDWMPQSGITGSSYSIQFIDENLGWTGASNGTYKTTNGGANWSYTAFPVGGTNWESICFINSEVGWISGNEGRIAKSTNGGDNWVLQNSETTDFIHSIVFVDPSNGWAATQSPAIINSTNGGQNWNVQSTISADYMNSMSFLNSFSGWAVGGKTILKYTGNGLEIDSPNGGEEWFIGTIQTIYWTSGNIDSIKIEYSTNNGSTWNEIVKSYPAASGSYNWSIPNIPSTECLIRITDLGGTSLFDISDQVFSILYQPTIQIISPNGGENWEAGSIHSITWASSNISNISLSLSTDNGSSWVQIVSSLPSSGVYNWIVTNTPSNQSFIMVADVSNVNLFDVSDNSFNITIPTDITDTLNVAMINDFRLNQNHPNPFNPSTIINFEIPVQINVLLKVYDLLGNEITTLVNEEKPIGSYKIEFDASSLSNGVYFYRLQAGNFVQTRKMILMK